MQIIQLAFHPDPEKRSATALPMQLPARYLPHRDDLRSHFCSSYTMGPVDIPPPPFIEGQKSSSAPANQSAIRLCRVASRETAILWSDRVLIAARLLGAWFAYLRFRITLLIQPSSCRSLPLLMVFPRLRGANEQNVTVP